MVTLDSLALRVDALETNPPVSKCTAEIPHVGDPGLAWTGSDYICTRCGNRYIKRPPGALQLVPAEVV